MNEMLPKVLAELNLQPGQTERIQGNGYCVEIRRPFEDNSEIADMTMLEPWVEFPHPGPAIPIAVRQGKLPLPDPPDIPADLEENES